MLPTEREADVGEYRVNYASAGRGDTILLLHGSDHRDDWHVWEPMLSLADRYGLVMPDLVGYGRSSMPVETPDYEAQAHAMKDLLERLSVEKANLIGTGWGGQVAMELALTWPETVKSMVLIASAYGGEQVGRLRKMRRPTLIIYAEDDMVTQLKAGYILRDAIGTSRLEVLDPVARDPSQGFAAAHKLERFRAPQVLQLVRLFLSKPEGMVSDPLETENGLRGLALRKDTEKREDAGPSETP